MSSLIHSRPTLFIGNKEVSSFTSIQFSDVGKNLATSLSVNLSDPELRRTSLDNKEVKFYLNYGSKDTVPFFRGRIKQINPTDTNLQITAYDIRSFLTGKESLPLTLTDNFNYDGYTLGQFLYSYITEYINIKDTIIGLDLLNDTDPVVSLSNIRAKSISPMRLIVDNLPNNSDSLSDIRQHRLTVIDDGLKSNICFVKEQSITDSGVRFTYSNGIRTLSIKKRPSPNLLSTNVNNSIVVYKHNNLSKGITAGKIEGDFNYPDQAIQQAFIQTTRNENNMEITLDATKGHYLNIGNVVVLNTPDYPEVNGKHRIVSKQISCSNSNISCKLQLSKEKPILSDYLS